jgi:hypothetical protein
MLAKNPSYITEDVLQKVTLRAADFWARCAPFLKNPIQPLTISKKCFIFSISDTKEFLTLASMHLMKLNRQRRLADVKSYG